METFDLIAPDYAVPMEQSYTVDTERAEDNTRWAELVDVNPTLTLNLSWTGLTETEALSLQAFYDARSGSLESFLFTPPILNLGEEAYGFASPFSWSRVDLNDYSLSCTVERRPLETP